MPGDAEPDERAPTPRPRPRRLAVIVLVALVVAAWGALYLIEVAEVAREDPSLSAP